MEYTTGFRIALKALGRHKLRTFLTMLGMIIGVGAVMTMVALGNGAQASVESDVKSAGTNLVYVNAGNYTRGGDELKVAAGLGAAKTLTPDDAAEIGKQVKGILHLAPGLSDRAPMQSGAGQYFGRVIGTSPAFARMHAWRFRSGAMFTEADLDDASAVVVIGTRAADRLFGSDVDPIGRTFTIRGRSYSVLGVTESRIEDQAESVFVPYSALQKVMGVSHLQTITIAAQRAGETARIAGDVTRLLRVRHKIGRGDGSEMEGVPDDFTVRTEAAKALSQGLYTSAAVFVLANLPQLDEITTEQMSGTLQQTSNTLTALLASIAAISLIVGGIGIMNIMLVSVTERTREIGLRMAVGARNRDVRAQFLVEACTLSIIGGVLGVVFGFAASSAVTRLLEWQTVMSAGAVGLAFSTALAVGVFFGFYPAQKASQLDPIDALRFE
jgi:ABC-type antimicrobial peptide transport system permease subunit